jgi:excisionase family DNA binding protein
MRSTPSYRYGHKAMPTADVRVLFTVEEAARALGIGRTRMFELIQDGHVETVLIGRLRRIPVDALDTFVNRLRESPKTTASTRQQ